MKFLKVVFNVTCNVSIWAFLQSEYLAGCDFRVRFLSGFSGSNAYVVVTDNKALLWTDGRYFVQVEKLFYE